MQILNPQRKQFLGKAAKPADLASSVDPEHLKVVWQLYRHFHVQHPGEPVRLALESLRSLLPESVDIYAVDYRAAMLNKLHYILSRYSEKLGYGDLTSRLMHFKRGEDLDDRLINVMARIPMEWMQMGFVYSGWPFNMGEFVHQVEQEPA